MYMSRMSQIEHFCDFIFDNRQHFEFRGFMSVLIKCVAQLTCLLHVMFNQEIYMFDVSKLPQNIRYSSNVTLRSQAVYSRVRVFNSRA